ncbi:RNA polymerase sigma factor [Pedobacter rhizosphaerae]|uniref:RNA polymerase sigma-70 factor, ECF subfamily n=1 Tax=Pedobacter rhizosphaerae TaxID=390241 RepID=A0A1H9R2A9_9SPHI|nr:RNA polymerase sigma-70 factor [Pedobacter rhizosphaerae]SER66828.1 RNA polymerase sigma-70 factor, ECF subfamily [Pedobacter rhizosphaerae]
MSELELIQAFRAGDIKAFEQIFNIFNKRLCYFAQRFVQDGATDIAQEVFVKLWERRHKHFDLESIKAFLYHTTKNQCLNVLKHQHVVERFNITSAPMVSDIDVSHKIISTEIASEIHEAIGLLAPGYRKVIHLSFFEEKSIKEIAEILHVSTNTVKTQKLRGLHLLRHLLRKPLIGTIIIFLFCLCRFTDCSFFCSAKSTAIRYCEKTMVKNRAFIPIQIIKVG